MRSKHRRSKANDDRRINRCRNVRLTSGQSVKRIELGKELFDGAREKILHGEHERLRCRDNEFPAEEQPAVRVFRFSSPDGKLELVGSANASTNAVQQHPVVFLSVPPVLRRFLRVSLSKLPRLSSFLQIPSDNGPVRDDEPSILLLRFGESLLDIR